MTSNKIPKVCSIEGCGTKRKALGFCYKHYQRNRFHGDPNFTELFVGKGDTPAQRFWSKVAITADTERCWNWIGTTQSMGYGYFNVDGKRRLAHRYAYLLVRGNDPVLNLLHSCDNRRCVNPNHLREGTQADNIADKVARGRQTKGSGIPSSKLTESDVEKVRALLATGLSTYKVAKRFGVGAETIRKIKIGRAWRHVGNDKEI